MMLSRVGGGEMALGMINNGYRNSNHAYRFGQTKTFGNWRNNRRFFYQFSCNCKSSTGQPYICSVLFCYIPRIVQIYSGAVRVNTRQAFSKLNMLENPAQFGSWLSQIVANKCRDYPKNKKPILFSKQQSDSDEGEEHRFAIF